jgi:hypothetical protein
MKTYHPEKIVYFELPLGILGIESMLNDKSFYLFVFPNGSRKKATKENFRNLLSSFYNHDGDMIEKEEFEVFMFLFNKEFGEK